MYFSRVKGRRERGGFTIVELLIVIVVIAILAAIAVVAYSGTQERARDAQRLQDVTNLQKAIGMYYARTGTMPPRSPASVSWADSKNYPSDYISDITGIDGGFAKLPVDPRNAGSMYYRYYVYSPGYYGCDAARGSFYVLQIMDMESTSGTHPKSPGFSCSGRNWSGEADYTVGGFTL